MKKIVLFIVFVANLVAYHRFEANINKDEFEAKLDLDLAQFIKKAPIERYIVGADYIYIENDDIENDSLKSINLMAKGRLPNFHTITIGLGTRFVTLDVAEKDVTAIPLGIYANFKMPIFGLPFALSTEYFYSPKPLTYSDGETFSEQKYEFSLEVIDMGELFVGYRIIEASIKNNVQDVTLSENGYIGFRIGF